MSLLYTRVCGGVNGGRDCGEVIGLWRRKDVRMWTNLFLLYRRHINKEIPDEINRRGLGVFIRRTFPKPFYQLRLSYYSKYYKEGTSTDLFRLPYTESIRNHSHGRDSRT